MTDREQQIINAIQAEPMISQSQLAEIIGISRSTIASHITNLTAKGIIEGRGYVIAPEKFCIAIGGANMDILGKPDKAIVDDTSNPGAVSHSPGGVARNIAENIAKLGHKCFLIAPIGDDDNGRQLIDKSREAGVDTSHMIIIAGQNTPSYLSIVDDKGEMQLAIADMAILAEFKPALLKKHLSILKQAKIIVLDTNISQELMAFLFENLPGADFFVDTVSVVKAVKIIPFLNRVHSLKPNVLEAQALSGIKITDDTQLPKLAAWFHDQGVKRLYISLGEKGLFYSDSQLQQLVSLPARQVCNSNGAGDAMTAALVHCHLEDTDAINSCYFALAAANCAIETQATINPNISTATIDKILKEKLC